jgi:hypothetical protein
VCKVCRGCGTDLEVDMDCWDDERCVIGECKEDEDEDEDGDDWEVCGFEEVNGGGFVFGVMEGLNNSDE